VNLATSLLLWLTSFAQTEMLKSSDFWQI